MKTNKIGMSIILIGLFLIVTLALMQFHINNLSDALMTMSDGKCFLDDGTCVHKKNSFPMVLGSILVVMLISLGIYLLFFSKTTRSIESIHKDIKEGIVSVQKKASKEEKLNILLQGLGPEEKKVLLAVKDQDGISQTTLKYRTGLSKTKLSMVLKDLEGKSIITKEKKGKINNIYLKKAL